MKKVLFISLALVLALSISLVGCGGGGPVGPTPSSTIVLAAAVSETGPLQEVHELAKMPIVDTYLALNPTITVGGTTFDVEIVYKNDGSSLANMLDFTDEIIDDINDGDAHFLLGPTCTAFLEAQAPKCTTAGVVQMTFEGGATSLFPLLSAYKYSFVNLSFSNWFQIPVLAKLLKEAHVAYNATDTPNAYIGYQNDDHGLEYLAEAQKYFGKEGIVIDGSYPMDSGDTGANADLIAAAKAAGSDILCVFAYPEHVFGTHAVAAAQDYNPKAMIIGPGGNFGVYSAPFIAGAAAEGVMCFAVGNNKTTVGNVADVILTMETEVGMWNTDYWGHPLYWTAMDFIYAAAAEVGSDNAGAGFTIDQTEYREFLATEKIDSVLGETYYVTPKYALNATQYGWAGGDLEWPVPEDKAGLISYKLHTGQIGQWQDGYIEIVGYDGIGGVGDEYGLVNYDVTDTFVYPKPDWPS